MVLLVASGAQAASSARDGGCGGRKFASRSVLKALKQRSYSERPSYSTFNQADNPRFQRGPLVKCQYLASSSHAQNNASHLSSCMSHAQVFLPPAMSPQRAPRQSPRLPSPS